jgi:hypothetical protein
MKMCIKGNLHTPNTAQYRVTIQKSAICKQSLGASLGVYQQDTQWLTQLLMYKHNHSHNFQKYLCQQISMKHVDKKILLLYTTAQHFLCSATLFSCAEQN